MSFPQIVLRVTPTGLGPEHADRVVVCVNLAFDEDQNMELIQNRMASGADEDSKTDIYTVEHAYEGRRYYLYRAATLGYTRGLMEPLMVHEIAYAINKYMSATGQPNYFRAQFAPLTDKVNEYIEMMQNLVREKSSFSKGMYNVTIVLDIVEFGDGYHHTIRFVNSTSSTTPVNPSAVARHFPQTDIMGQVVAHPKSGMRHDLSTVIMDLNDNEDWSFDQIADWLDTLDINTKIARREEMQ